LLPVDLIKAGPKKTILWALFALNILLAVLYLLKHLLAGGGDVPLASLLSSPRIPFPALIPGIILLLLHACWSLGYRRGPLLLGLAFVTGFLFEAAGVNLGIAFGGQYSYQENAKLALLGVPFIVPLFWAAFIYIGYWLTTTFFRWTGRDKPQRNKDGLRWLLLAVCLDGLAVLLIDLIMDPLQVAAGNWQWLEPGAFYGVPWGNFLGWFLVTVIASGIFRSLEYYLPPEKGEDTGSAVLIPVIGYGLLGPGLAVTAIKLDTPELIPIGSILLALALGNLLLFSRQRQKAVPPGGAGVTP
jgi:putative membrane protein